MDKILPAASLAALLAVSCGTCYQDRFAYDVVGMTQEEVAAAVGAGPADTRILDKDDVVCGWKRGGAAMSVLFINGKASVCTVSTGEEDCNIFVPDAWMARYKREGETAEP